MISSRYRLSQIIFLLIFAGWFTFIFWGVKNKSPFAAVVMFYMVLGIVVITFFRAPFFSFTENSIKRNRFFQRAIYEWDDVEEVHLSVKEDFPIILLGRPMEAMKLVFKNGKSFIVFDGMYNNMPAMRAIVTEKLNSRLHFVVPHQKRNVQKTIVHKKYEGNVFTSINTLLIVGLIIFFIIEFNIRPGSKLLLLPFFFGLMLYIGEGFQMYFFEIQFDKFIIRNQFFPWKRKEYSLNEIEEVSKERGIRASDGLRILTYNFESKLYRAGSLRYSHWEDLFNDLTLMGIKISNT